MRNLRSFPLTCFLLSIFFLALPGCKLKIKAPIGGAVVSTDGAYTCEAGETCIIDVVDLFFDQTFVAEPEPGYYFSHWKKFDRHLCAGDTEPCRLSTAGFEGNSELESMLESDESFYLEPQFVFKLGSCPEPELVISPGLFVH